MVSKRLKKAQRTTIQSRANSRKDTVKKTNTKTKTVNSKAKSARKIAAVKKIAASKKIVKSKKIRKTYKNTEEKKKEMLFVILKDYKERNVLDIGEIMCDSENEEEVMVREECDKDYSNITAEMLADYKNCAIDATEFVFPKDSFENLLRRMKVDS